MGGPWKAFALVLTVLAWGGAPARAGDPRCPLPPRAVAVSVETARGEVVYHNSRDGDALARMQSGAGRGLAAGWMVTGLTQSDLEYRLSSRVTIQPMRGGGYCVHLTEVSGFLGYTRLDVHISSKYRPGSCEYRAVLDHEHRHVAVFREVLDRHAPEFRRSLEREARGLGWVFMASADTAAERMQQRVDRAATPLLRRIEAEEKRANAGLDTPESYRRDQARCESW